MHQFVVKVTYYIILVRCSAVFSDRDIWDGPKAYTKILKNRKKSKTKQKNAPVYNFAITKFRLRRGIAQ